MPVEHIAIEDPKELVNIVSKELNEIEKGLKIIGNEIPVDEKTKIGMLCHDEHGQLVIVQTAIKEDKNMIFEALKCVDYVDKFKTMLAVTYPKSKIDTAKTPRVILLAPEYSEEVINIVKRIKGVQINLYTWEYLKIGDYKGLHIEPIFIYPLKKEEKLEKKPKKEEEKPAKKKEEKEKKEEKSAPETAPKPKPKPETEPKPKPEPEPKPIKTEVPKTEQVFPPPEEKKKKEQKRRLKLF